MRELDGKLWLALHLVRSGARVVLGPDVAISANLGTLGPDIHLLNSAYSIPLYEMAITKVRRAGGRIAVLDTEGGLYRSREAYATRLSPDLLARVDHFLAWGSDPASIVVGSLAGRPGPQIAVTGHPTFDLLQAPVDRIFEPEAQELRQELGHFVLVNTNFGYANPYVRKLVDQRTETALRRQMEDLLLERLITVLIGLARAFPSTQIVIRPHPSEDHDTYRRRVAGVRNLHVHHRGPVSPWLRACAVLVHNACTTGVEAALLGRPVLAYCPTAYHMEEFSVANSVSERVPDDPTLTDRVHTYLETPSDARREISPAQHSFLARYIANVGFSSAERIADLFMSGESRARAFFELGSLPLRAFIAVAREGALDQVRAVRGATARKQLAYVRQKFPGLSRAEVEDRIRRMAGIDPSLGHVRVRRAAGIEHTLILEPK